MRPPMENDMATKLHKVTIRGFRHSISGVPTTVEASYLVTASQLRKLKRVEHTTILDSRPIKVWDAQDIINDMGIKEQ